MERFVRYFLLSAIVAFPVTARSALIEFSSSKSGCGESCKSANRGRGWSGSQLTRKSERRLRKYNEKLAAAYGNPCASGRCTARSTWHDYGLNWCGPCGPIGKYARRGCPCAQKICYCCNTKAFPDSGWAPPARMPVNRTNTGFSTFSSNGTSYSGAPMVYQPTDTAQLGYSYAHVPTWKPNPSMIPRTPSPSRFHARFCPPDKRCGICSGCPGNRCTMTSTPAYGDCYGGACFSGDCYGGDCYGGDCYGGDCYGGDCYGGDCYGGAIYGTDCLGGECSDGSFCPGFGQLPATPPKTLRLTTGHTKNTGMVSMKSPQAQPNLPPSQHQPTIQMTSNTSQMTPNTSNKPQANSKSQSQSRPSQRRTSNRRRPQSQGGWFGWPSLREVLN